MKNIDNEINKVEIINRPHIHTWTEQRLLISFSDYYYYIKQKGKFADSKTIICSAVLFKKENRLVLGARHYKCLRLHNELYNTKYNENGETVIGGFFTLNGMFVDRSEGFILANDYNVVEKVSYREDWLFSEDIIKEVYE